MKLINSSSYAIFLVVAMFALFSVTTGLAEPIHHEDNYLSGGGSPIFLILLLILILVIIVACLAVGVAIGLAVFFAISLLLTLGVLSTSTMAGIATKKPSNFAKVLIYQLVTVAFMVVGVSGALGIDYFLLDETHYSTTALAILGAAGGLIAGLIFAGVVNFSLDRLLGFLKEKFGSQIGTKEIAID